MKASDLGRARVPGVPSLSPDGRHAVVALRRADLDADDYPSQLWLVTTDGSAPPRQLTQGYRDFGPAYSPDGRWLAFQRVARSPRDGGGRAKDNAGAGPDRAGSDHGGPDDEGSGHGGSSHGGSGSGDFGGGPGAGRHGDKPQIYVLPTDGGDPRRLTDHPLGAGAPVWSPDSTRLAYTARVPEPGRYGTDEKITPDKEPPRRITTLLYRMDDLGYTEDRRNHVWVVDALADHPEPTQVTEGDFDNTDVHWSPRGDLLTFVSARHPTRGEDLRSDVYVCAPDGSALRALTHGGLGVGLPHFSTDGLLVCFTAGPLSDNDRAGVCRNEGLWAVPVDGSAPARQLTDQEQLNLAAPAGMIEPVDGGVLFTDEHRGAVRLLLVPYDGGEPEVLVDGRRQVIGATIRAGVTAVTVADPYSWGELAVRRADGALETLTAWNAAYPIEVGVLPMAELNATAPDGYPVHGWVVWPEGAGPFPVLLLIHGGPFAQYGWRLFDEAQVYAGAGYAVVMGNPRGSSGYGEAHGRAVMGNVGEMSAIDLLTLLDAALADPTLDGSRVGVMGGSHGGFMTTWLAAHHGDRFRAGISERAVNAIDSFTGSSDIGWFFAADLYGPDVDQQDKQSPLTHADRIELPLLIIHSEQDWRCPMEQAQRLYVALKRRGVPVEMLLFPGEGHEMSRSGTPSHRVARFEAILDWWRRYL